MTWFWYALLAPLLYSICNHIDKHLLEKYLQDKGIGTLLMFSALAGLLVLPFIVIVLPEVVQIPLEAILLLLLSGFLYTLYLFPYFEALRRAEASIAIPWFQTIPFFGFILGYFFLGESLTGNQVVGGMFIIAGAVGITIEPGQKTYFKKDVVGLMLVSSLLVAAGTFLFKYAAIEVSFWPAIFWENVGLVLFAILFLLPVAKYRNDFFELISKYKAKFLSLNVANELIGLGAGFAASFAVLLAPLALVQIVNGFQPFFVFVIGLLITVFFPKFGTEDISLKVIVRKAVFITIVFVGTYILFQ